MFNNPVPALRAGYKAMLEAWREQPLPLMRSAAFMAAAAGSFESFREEPALHSIKLTCVTTADVHKQPLCVRLRHHFKLELQYTDRPKQVNDANDWAIQCLPYESMAEGVHLLTRDHDLVRRALSPAAGDAQVYDVAVYQLAREMDLAFTPVEVIHDTGLESAG